MLVFETLKTKKRDFLNSNTTIGYIFAMSLDVSCNITVILVMESYVWGYPIINPI